MASRVSADPWAIGKGYLIPDTPEFDTYLAGLQSDPSQLDQIRAKLSPDVAARMTPGDLAAWEWRDEQLQKTTGTDPVIGQWQSAVDSGQLSGKDLPAPYGLDENGQVVAVPTGMKKDPTTGQLVDQNVFMKHPWLIAPAAIGAGLGATALTGGFAGAGALASTPSASIGTLPGVASSGAVDAALGGGSAVASGAPALAGGVLVPTTAEGVTNLAAAAPGITNLGAEEAASLLPGAANFPAAGIPAAATFGGESAVPAALAAGGAGAAGGTAAALASGGAEGVDETTGLPHDRTQTGDDAALAAGSGGIISTLKGIFGPDWAKLLTGAGLTALGDFLGKPQQRKSFAGTDADPTKLLSGAMGEIGNLSGSLKKQIQSGPQLTAYAQPVKGLDSVDPAYNDRSLLKYPGLDLGLDLSAGTDANKSQASKTSDTSATGTQGATRNQPDASAIQSTTANTGYLDTNAGTEQTMPNPYGTGTTARLKYNATGDPTTTAASSLGLTPQQQAAIQLVKSTQGLNQGATA